MKTYSILGLVRDIGAGNVVAPVMEELRLQGHKTLLLVERGGKAKDVLTTSFTVVPNRAALRKVFAKQRPDVVIVGLSSPRMLENELDAKASLSGVPIVHIEDYWGCHVRSSYRADLYVTVDEMSARFLQGARPGVPVIIAGYHGYTPSAPRLELVRKVEDLRQRTGAKVLVYPDGGPECGALPMLVESLLQTRRPVMLAPKPHPKSSALGHPSGGSWGEWLNRALGPLREVGKVVDFAEPTNEVADCADGVISGYGSIIMRPAMAGKLALTLWTPAVRELLKQETGLDATPLMLHGFPVLEKTQPLDEFLQGPYPMLDLKPFDARVAAAAVLALIT